MIFNNLKYHREKCGLTQQQVADALNINRSTYTYYEKGKTEPSINTTHKMMRLFDVSFSELFPNNTTIRVAESTAPYIANQSQSGYAVTNLSSVEKDMLFKIRLLNEEDRIKIMNEINKLCEGFL